MTTESIPQLSKKLQSIFGKKADKLGQESQFIKRKVKVTGSLFSKMLVFGWLNNPDATLENLCQTGAAVGLKITPQGLEQRFTAEGAEFLMSLLEEVVAEIVMASPTAHNLLQQFPQVVIEDSSTVTLPTELASIWLGCGGSPKASKAAVKMQVRWDMVSGGLDGPHLSSAQVADKVASQAHQSLPKGSLRITDLGYWKLEIFREQEVAGLYYLTRLKANTLIQHGTDWLCITDFLAQQDAKQVDMAVTVGKGEQLAARLLAIRVPDAVAVERRRKLKQTAKRKGKTLSKQRLAMAEWTVFITNVPADMLSLEQALVLMQMRWQIELLFKLWKNSGKLDKSRSERPWRILCEFYAKLIAMIIQHWTLLLGLWTLPERSLVKASAVVRQHALSIVMAIQNRQQLVQALSICVDVLASGNRIHKSQKTPRLFQLLVTFDSLDAA